MRRLAWTGLLVTLLSACGVTPRVAPMTTLPTTQAQWAGQDSGKLVRQLVLATFDRADRNHDRFLDKVEWDKADLTTTDLDKDGRVTTLEWAEANPIEPLQAKWQAAAADYFAHLDADKNGWLSRAEAKGLAAVPGIGMPTDLLFDRYSALNAGGLSPRVFTDFVLQVVYDAGRFHPVVTPPAWPTGDVVKPTPPTPGMEPPTIPAPTLSPDGVSAQSRPRR